MEEKDKEILEEKQEQPTLKEVMAEQAIEDESRVGKECIAEKR